VYLLTKHVHDLVKNRVEQVHNKLDQYLSGARSGKTANSVVVGKHGIRKRIHLICTSPQTGNNSPTHEPNKESFCEYSSFLLPKE
jgi:hypothetical protein